MSASCFDDKKSQPAPEELQSALGDANMFWEEIKDYIRKTLGEFVQEWRYYNTRSGWLLKILYKSRNQFFLVPRADGFMISFIFGDRAVTAVESADVPEAVKTALRDARKYMEGRGINVEVSSSKDVETIKQLISIKNQC